MPRGSLVLEANLSKNWLDRLVAWVGCKGDRARQQSMGECAWALRSGLGCWPGLLFLAGVLFACYAYRCWCPLA